MNPPVLFDARPYPGTLADRLQRENEANTAGMKKRDEWEELIRLTMVDAGITNQTFIENAKKSLIKASKATCFLQRGPNFGTGTLVDDTEFGFVVITANHNVPDEEASAQTNVYFDYDTDWKLDTLRPFSVRLMGFSPRWNVEAELDTNHLDYSVLQLVLDREDDKDFLKDRKVPGNPTDSLLDVDDSILAAMHNGPKYMPLFLFSHPRGLGMRLSAGPYSNEDRKNVFFKFPLPVLHGSSGGNILLCPLTGPKYEHWWASFMCSGIHEGSCLAVPWSQIYGQ